MIDWHSHILTGVDDRPTDIEESVVPAGALAAGGFTEVYCTPHLVRGCHEAGNDEVRWSMARLQERLDMGGIPITLRSGREYCLDENLREALAGTVHVAGLSVKAIADSVELSLRRYVKEPAVSVVGCKDAAQLPKTPEPGRS